MVSDVHRTLPQQAQLHTIKRKQPLQLRSFKRNRQRSKLTSNKRKISKIYYFLQGAESDRQSKIIFVYFLDRIQYITNNYTIKKRNRLAILLRGPPGAGKSFIAKTIKEKECEMNGSVRILSIDDYFTTESDEQSNGKMIYEYDAAMEDKYMQCLAKSFRKTLIDRLFDVIIVDCNNITLEYLNDFHSSALVHQYTVSTFGLFWCFLETKVNNITSLSSHTYAKCH